MIDALVKLLEKLVELVKIKKEAEEKILDLVIIPLFKDFKAIHEDYLKLFEDCRRDLAGDADLRAIVRQLSKDRVANEALRRSIASMVTAYAKNPKLSRYHDFFQAVAAYADAAEWSRPSTASTSLLEMLEHWAGEGDEDKFQIIWQGENGVRNKRVLIAETIAVTDISLKRLREAWERVSRSYAEIHLSRAL